MSILKQVRKELKEFSNEKDRQTSFRFFKEEIKPYGVKANIVNKIANKYFKIIKDSSKQQIFTLCENLWQSGMLEETFIACNWTYKIHNRFEEKDFDTFAKWINQYVNNWASCDTFCNHTVGIFLEMYPKQISKLIDFTKSNNRWVKRASAVSLIIPAKKGLFINEIIIIADKLLLDKDDLVQKGYGWMLKSLSNYDAKLVLDYVLKNKSVMPRTALRYAIEKMSKEDKKLAMVK